MLYTTNDYKYTFRSRLLFSLALLLKLAFIGNVARQLAIETSELIFAVGLLRIVRVIAPRPKVSPPLPRTRRVVALFLARVLLLFVLRFSKLADMVKSLPLVAADALVALVVLNLGPTFLLDHVRDRDLVSKSTLEEVKVVAEGFLQHLNGFARVVFTASSEMTNALEGLPGESHSARQKLSHPRARDLALVGETAHVLSHIDLHLQDLGR